MSDKLYSEEAGFYPYAKSETTVDARKSLVTRTYLNLAGAAVLFAILETLALTLVGPQGIMDLAASSPRVFGFAMLGLCIGGPFLANAIIARSTTRLGHYVALLFYVALYTLIFMPIMACASHFCGAQIILQAMGLTAALFTALSAAVFMTRTDFSFLRTALTFTGIASLILIVASLIFGFTLGTWFSVAMIVFMCFYILYETSGLIHQAGPADDVLVSIQLFSSLMTLFFYILRLLMALNRR